MKYLFFTLLLYGTFSAYAQTTEVQKTFAEFKMPKGEAVQKDNLEEYYLSKAKYGKHKSMFRLGVYYQENNKYKEGLEWLNNAANLGNTEAITRLCYTYLKGIGVAPDYNKANYFIDKVMDKNLAYANYLKGYLLFKGLGCKQDYKAAFELFNKKPIAEGKYYVGNMYMVGICYRNGYGVEKNIEKANYWLAECSKLGYKDALEELNMPDAELPTKGTSLHNKIQEAVTKIAPQHLKLNSYNAVNNTINANNFEGTFEGYLLTYDWSGKNIIAVEPLKLDITAKGGLLNGAFSLPTSYVNIPVNASIKKEGLDFSNMVFSRTDHYDAKIPVSFNITNSAIKAIYIEDSTYLYGSLNLFCIDRNEPEKQTVVVLVRTSENSKRNELITLSAEAPITEVGKLLVYPNPFTSVINMSFVLTETTKLTAQIHSLDGKLVYTMPETTLQAGNYSLPLFNKLSAGTYVISLKMGTKLLSSKIVKL